MRLMAKIGASGLMLILLLTVAILAGCGSTKPQQQADTNDKQTQPQVQTGIDSEKKSGPEVWEPYKFKPGDFFKYDIMQQSGNGVQKGWYTLEVLPQSGEQVQVVFNGELDKSKFSVQQTTELDNVMQPIMQTLMMQSGASGGSAMFLLLSPGWVSAFQLGNPLAQSEYKWTDQDGKEHVYKTTGKKTYAGVTGYSGIATENGQEVISWCVSPGYPLALYSKLKIDEQVYESTLVDVRRGK